MPGLGQLEAGDLHVLGDAGNPAVGGDVSPPTDPTSREATVRTLTRTRAATAGIAGVALLLAACGGEMPPIDGDTPSGSGTDGTAAAVDLPGCPDFDEPRTYDPPPEEQPDTDPSVTSSEMIDDLDVGEDPASRDGGMEDPDREDVPDGAAPPAPMDPMSAAQEWGRTEAGEHFAGIWFDNDHGAAVIAFTDDVDRYAAEVRDRFGDPWWVVRAERSLAELTELADAVGQIETSGAETGQPGSLIGWGPREDRGVVGIDVVGGDDQALADLAAQLDDPAYCFEVIDPPTEPDLDDDAAVRTLATVEGWRDGLEPSQGALLEIAHDEEAAARLVDENVPAGLDAGPDGEPWQDGRHGDLADVDLSTHVVAVYSAGRSGSCPEWVADVSTGGEGVTVGTEVPSRGACTDDFNPYRTVLAIERDLLPSVDQLPTALDRGYDAVPDAVVAYP